MKTVFCATVCCLLTAVMFAVDPSNEAADEMNLDDLDLQAIPLPERDNPEYWVIRSEAMSEIIPLLTRKRAEIKQKRQRVADYLDRIGKTEQMAASQIDVPQDPALYAEALGWSDSIRLHDIELPKTMPSWEQTAEFAMRFIIDEGYVPIQFDGIEDMEGFVDVCRRKDTYARKVRDEMRAYLNDYLEMWLYLEQSGEQFAYRDWITRLELEAERHEQAIRKQLAEQRRQAAVQRREFEKQQEFQLARNREAFRSTRRERMYYTRERLLLYRQARLDALYSGYYYCW